VREFSTPASFELQATGNLTDDVVLNARDFAQTVIFSRPGADGAWEDVTAEQFLAETTAVAKGLVAAGIQQGDRVAIFSKTRYEWTLLDYAIWFAGAVTVPIYETSSVEQVRWILEDGGVHSVLAQGADHVARVHEARQGLDVANVWSFNDNAVATLVALGGDIADDEIEKRRTAVTSADPATLIYTSGTTGRPKGVVLTHGNFMVELGVVVEELDHLFLGETSTLLFLPLAHVFARIIQIGCVKSRTRLGHSPDIKNLLDDLGAFKPSFILAVPRVFEKVYNTASQKAAADGKGKIFNLATDVAIAYSRAEAAGRVPLTLRAKHAVFARLVYSKLRNALGGNCQYAVSGGAPLGERLGHFYRGIGLTVLEGYGLTETTGAVTVNLPDALKIGTVGRPIGGTTVRVADDGELLFKGGQVFERYWNNPEATASSIIDGWFHTGDLGEVDDEGFVRITGRKKEIIVTAGGKNVAPAVLEDRLRAHVLVDQCMVVGDGQPFIGALVTIDPESLPTWAAAHGKQGGVEELYNDPDLHAEVQKAVDDANKAVSHAESIKKFAILPDAWTEEGGQLTPSLKLKRNVVMREFKDEVDALYQH
jgi:long-chain acyl-CoA synthetase